MLTSKKSYSSFVEFTLNVDISTFSTPQKIIQLFKGIANQYYSFMLC